MRNYAIIRKEREIRSATKVALGRAHRKRICKRRSFQHWWPIHIHNYYVRFIYDSYIIENARKFRHRWICKFVPSEAAGNGQKRKKDDFPSLVFRHRECGSCLALSKYREKESEQFRSHAFHTSSAVQSIETVYRKPNGQPTDFKWEAKATPRKQVQQISCDWIAKKKHNNNQYQ